MLFVQELRLSTFSAKITGKCMVRLPVSIINHKYRNMNIRKVWDASIKENDNPSSVKTANAVVEQLGGVDEDTMLNSPDSCRNANDGYTGFCYPSQTCKFWNGNRSAVIENMHELADGLGEDLITMIKGFGDFKDGKSVTCDAIGKALYAPFDENGSRYTYDTLAKHALEEAANRFQNRWYDQDESEFVWPNQSSLSRVGISINQRLQNYE